MRGMLTIKAKIAAREHIIPGYQSTRRPLFARRPPLITLVRQLSRRGNKEGVCSVDAINIYFVMAGGVSEEVVNLRSPLSFGNGDHDYYFVVQFYDSRVFINAVSEGDNV